MTLFKLNPLAAACAAALSLSAGQALALTAFEAPDVDIYLSGASAPQNLLGEVANKLFDSSQGIFVYHDNNGSTNNFGDDGRSYRAYFGVVKADPSIKASLHGKKVLLVNRAKGGSVWGVNPVARAEAIATMKIDSASCTLNTGIYRCPEVGNDLTPTADNRVPDFGVSDVEPNMFKGPYNVEFGADQLDPTEAVVFDGTQFGASSLMMGIVATNAVPDTLPISRAEYGAMLSGLITDWGNVADGSISGPVAVCRRVQGSGTQASYNWFFNNFPCAQNSLHGTAASTPPARMADSAGYDSAHAGTSADPILIDPSAGYTVVENPSSGNVRDCLARAQSGTDHTFTGDDGKVYKVRFSLAPATKAIGVLSLDSLNSENGWSFRALDGAGRINPATDAFECTNADQLECGIAPTKANHREGRYDFAVELSFQYRNTTAGASALGGLKKDVADEFIELIGDPAVLSTLAAGPKEATIALPINYDPTTNSNVAKATHYGNTCAPLQKFF
ncbi:MAG: hypothetical protein H5U26_07595 [Immundisolibacter sp.]|uniref:hypothetical protein n=1 Tax=Immundisolibacter sp. TaxID=1934948 RepID=UPI0019AC0E7A|nr:hypothetical protein [Immundisolibacter sp.]MBC7161954.1 hypothetical protein [Immundisolibacter sp.]